MHNVFRLLLFFAILITLIYGQGGGGSRGGGGGGRSSRSRGVRYQSRPPCTDDACRRREKIQNYVIGSLFFIGAIFFIYRWWNKPSKLTHETYVNLSTDETDTTITWDVFQSGSWSSRYYQYGQWHGPHRLSLRFDNDTSKVTGDGSDDVGTYTIEGLFSTKNNRIGLTKTYRKGTGDPTQNLGHQVTIQMAWDTSERRFKGTWFVKTYRYTGEDLFELELAKSLKASE